MRPLSRRTARHPPCASKKEVRSPDRSHKGGMVDGHEEAAAAVLVGHRGQVFHVDGKVSGCAGLEGALRGLRLSVLQRLQISHAMAPQAAVKTRAGGVRVEELAHHGEQIVERQQKRLRTATATACLAQASASFATVRRVDPVLDVAPLAPRPDGLLADPWRSAASLAGSLLAWIATRIFGVVVACFCKETSMLLPGPNLAQHRLWYKQGRSARVYVIIRDETVGRPGAGPEDFRISAPQCLVARGDIGFSITPAFAHFEIGGRIKHALHAA